MATILNTLYPPLIDTFMPAFPYNGPATINFTISPYNSYIDIKYVHVTLVNQKTNQNVFKNNIDNSLLPSGTKIINGIWIIPFNYSTVYEESNDKKYSIWKADNENNFYTLKIPAKLLNGNVFVTNNYYKLQIRFDSSTTNIENISDTSYLTSNTRAYFSEWSSVCLLKAIPEIDLTLHNFTVITDNDITINGQSITEDNFSVREPQFTPGIIPFAGNLIFSTNSGVTTSSTEYLSYYYIDILDSNLHTYLESGKQFPTNKKSSNFYYLFDLTNASINTDYYVEITCVTNNQYKFTKRFLFRLIESSDVNFNPEWKFNRVTLPYNDKNEKVLITSEDGLVNITIQATNVGTAGYLFIKRANSLDNFKKWELIDCSFIESSNVLEHSITDSTVGSLTTYKYSCQFLTQKGSWSQTYFSSEIVYPDFHDILISRGDKQLAIRYNAQITSLTPVVNRVKIDTLGGRYPKFAQNAKLNYKQFQLNGLIVAESDYNRKFLSDLDYRSDMAIYDEKMNGKYIIRNDTVKENYWDDDYTGNNGGGTYTADIIAQDTKIQKQKRDTQKATTHDIYPTNNWWWERTFREEAIKWLNDGEPKLFRSMTEGNLIVMIDSISLTPNAQLGRRIWNFSCTIYEVGNGYSLKELSSLGIYNVNNDWAEIKTGQDGEEEDNPSSSANVIKEEYLGQSYEFSSENNTNGSNIPIIPTLNTLYQNGVYQNYKLKENSVYLQNLKIQFYSEPQLYIFQDNNIVPVDILSIINEQQKDKKESEEITKKDIIDYIIKNIKDVMLGYRLTLTAISSTDTSLIDPSEFTVNIFVNKNGYYQVPSTMVVKNITLYDGAQATLDYILHYDIEYDNVQEADSYENVENIVGQISGKWNSGSDVFSEVQKKYEFYEKDAKKEIKQSVDYWTGVDFDLTPYSIIKLSDSVNDLPTEYIIGRTGILNLQPDFHIEACTIMGRRMIKVDNDRKDFLDEWECVFDESLFWNNQSYWYILGDILYQINYDNDFEKNLEQIENEWKQLGKKSFIEKYKDYIKIPEINTVYKIIDENGITKNNIYYLNQGWFNVVISENPSIIYARVPVNGMIGYRAGITKRIFITD